MSSVSPGSRRRSLPLGIAVVVLTLTLASTPGSHAATAVDTTQLPPAAQRTVDFERDIRPIFSAHCVSCHGLDKQRGGLRLENRTAALKGGENHAPAIRPGQSADSPLIHFVSGAVPDLQMPPKGERLTAEQIGLLRAWIDQGAPWQADAAAEPAVHWALRPVVRPPVPVVATDSPSRVNAVDDFVLRKLQDHQLTLNPPADRRAWIRRLYLVMHGLPPTPEEVESFVNDRRPEAVEALVDRVLASPRYGERWGRHWLDVVRYADSNGFETNRERKNAHPYRDYVIHCFNDDVPYDQFVREQLAGDALGADTATGFLVAGAYDIVKSPDINLTLMQRQDELADIVNTTGTAFLGLTLGCARCHDHKFDPISQKDYYALQAVFAGVNFADRALPVQRTPAETAELAARQQDAARCEAELNALRHRAREQSTTSTTARRPAVNERRNEEEFPAREATAVRFTILATNGGEPCLDELEVFDVDGRNIALADTGARVRASGTLPGFSIHRLEHLNDGVPGNARSWISDTSGQGWVIVEFPAARRIQRVVWSRDREGNFKDRVATQYRLEATDVTGAWTVLTSSETREPAGKSDPNAFLQQLSAADQTRARALREELKQAQAQVKRLTSGATAWLGTFSQPTNTHRLYRGDPLQPREVVPPDAVAVLGTLGLTSDTPEQQRRLKLAEWLTQPQNPLTARVMVNRVWHYVFGSGLVDTPSDFGANGGKPTHPELLDWLTDEFIRSGWSVKQLQKRLLLSGTFRQSSAPRADGLAQDADARMLWRFPPRRLEAEAIRDSMLAASGALDLRMGGPGFHLQKVEEDNVYRYFPKETFGPPEFRRMVYLARIRQEQDSVFGSFDCPSGNQVLPKRTRSNTPLQALNLFNSNFVLQQADLLAERLETEAGTSAPTQISRAFQLMYGRAPDDFEVQTSIALIQDHGLPAFCRGLLNTSEFLFLF